MIERPIITEVEFQTVDHYENDFKRTVIRNVGKDKDGKRWQWFSVTINHDDGTQSFGNDYGWTPL